MVLFSKNAMASEPPKTLSLEWPSPVRALPGVEMEFQFAAQNPLMERLTWKLEGEPKGMSISPSGLLKWTPGKDDLGTKGPITLTVSGEKGGKSTKSFSLEVGPKKFILVSSKKEEATALGVTHAASLEEALALVPSNSGRTILLGEGPHQIPERWESLRRHPLRGKKFKTDDLLEILGRKTAVIDCKKKSDGLSLFQVEGVRVANISVENAAVTERGGVTVNESKSICLERVRVKKAEGSFRSNPCAFQIGNSTDIVLQHCSAIDSRDPDDDSWNSTSFLLYTEGDSGHLATLIGCESRGSVVGFKIKHAGPKTLVLQDCQSIGEEFGFALASKGSILRGCLAMDCGVGLQLGVTDPKKRYTSGGMTIENCAFIRCKHGVEAQEAEDAAYSTEENILRRCLFLSEKEAGGNERDHRHVVLYPYSPVSEVKKRCMVRMSNCVHASPKDENLFRVGKGEGKDLSLKDFQLSGFSKDARFLPELRKKLEMTSFSADETLFLSDKKDFVGPIRPGERLNIGSLVKP